MRRLTQIFALATVLVSGHSLADGAGNSPVLMYVTEGSRDLELMLTEEVGVMQQMLEEAGYSVEFATAGNQTMQSETRTLEPTVKLNALNIDDYAGVIVPCMAPAPGEAPPPAEIVDLLTAAIEQDKPVAASRGSVALLAKAGGVNDRQYAYASPVDTSKRPEFAGGAFVGIGVVRDGNVSTAGICPLASRSLGEPDGTVELTQNFIASLSEST